MNPLRGTYQIISKTNQYIKPGPRGKNSNFGIRVQVQGSSSKPERRQSRFVIARKKIKRIGVEYSEYKEKAYEQPHVLGKKVWENSNADLLINELRLLRIETNDDERGLIGYHCTPHWKEMLKQAESNPEGQIEERMNKVGEGLYLAGNPDKSVHFTGCDLVFKVLAKNKIQFMDEYGTGTLHTVPGTGGVYILEMYEVNPAYLDHIDPPFIKTRKEAIAHAFNKVTNSDKSNGIDGSNKVNE